MGEWYRRNRKYVNLFSGIFFATVGFYGLYTLREVIHPISYLGYLIALVYGIYLLSSPLYRIYKKVKSPYLWARVKTYEKSVELFGFLKEW